ncbi:MAG: YtxH domain-containing protein [Bacteroidetes bacterium]|nr:YtxH domain-containing protein [Bacteroidota bacterium]
MKRSKTLFGVIAGLAAGALIGFLFAPGKGGDTRKKITDKARETIQRIKTKLNQSKL